MIWQFQGRGLVTVLDAFGVMAAIRPGTPHDNSRSSRATGSGVNPNRSGS